MIFPDRGARAYPYGIYDLGATPASSTWARTTTRVVLVAFGSALVARRGRAVSERRRPAHHCDVVQQRLAPAAVEMGVTTTADQTGLALRYATSRSTSKWNKVEHRLFSFICQLRGEPLRDYETVVRLIAATTTLRVEVTCAWITVSTPLDARSRIKNLPISI